MLAMRKRYHLVGVNKYGFNVIFVGRNLGDEVLPKVSVASILRHPRNAATWERSE